VALLVKVTARICRYPEWGFLKANLRYSKVRVYVFPEPAEDLYSRKGFAIGKKFEFEYRKPYLQFEWRLTFLTQIVNLRKNEAEKNGLVLA